MKLTSWVTIGGATQAALLEVLDPAQNGTFGDHYMEVDYDLSDDVPNREFLRMPQPLLDRMEIIRIGVTRKTKSRDCPASFDPRQIEKRR